MNYINNFFEDFSNINFSNILYETSIYSPLILKIENNSSYTIKIKKNKTIKKDTLASLGYTHKESNLFYKYNVSKNNIIDKTKYSKINFYVLNTYLYPYWSVTPGPIENIRKINYVADKKENDLYKTITEYFLSKKNEFFIYFSHTLTQFRLFLTLHEHSLLPNIEKCDTLFLYQLESLLEIEDYFIYRENMSELYYYDNVDIVKILPEKDTNVQDNIIIEKYKKIYPINFINFTDYFCENNYYPDKKYNFINTACYIYDFKYKDNIETTNAQQIFNQVLILLKLLKLGGSGIISIGNVYSKIMTDIIVILSTYFKDIYIEKNVLMAPLRPYKKIVCKNFIGIEKKKFDILENIRKEWYNYNNTCGMDFEKNTYFINSLLETASSYNIIQNQIKVFNIIDSRRSNKYFEYIFSTFNYIKKYSKKKDIENTLYNIIDNNILYSKILLEQKNIPNYEFIFSSKSIISRFLSSPKIYYFIKNSNNNNNNNTKNNSSIQIKYNNVYDNKKTILKLIKYKNKLQFTKRSLDFINNNDYKNLTKNIKIYRYIKIHLSSIFNTNISFAFLKMTELLHVSKIIKNNNKIYKSFHLCEAPGQFIMALHYYLQTKTNNKIHDWYASSLNPKYSNNALNDIYGLMKKYKNRWLYGEDNTGDITNMNNIKNIKENIPDDIQLITSDCGKNLDDKTFIIQEKDYCYLNISQIRAILYLLPINSNCIFKTFLPLVLPINISLIYILYIYFNEISIYKPSVNPTSSEIYIICKKYKGIPNSIMSKLIHITKENIDIKNNIIPVNKYFYYMYVENITSLIKNNIESIQLNIYLYRNYKNIVVDDIIEPKKIIENWTKQYSFFIKPSKLLR